MQTVSGTAYPWWNLSKQRTEQSRSTPAKAEDSDRKVEDRELADLCAAYGARMPAAFEAAIPSHQI